MLILSTILSVALADPLDDPFPDRPVDGRPTPVRPGVGPEHPILTGADLVNLTLPVGAVPHNVSRSKTVAVGDADNDGILEVLTTDDWNVSLWQWEDSGLVPDGTFRMPFVVDAANRGIVAACISDAGGHPGNETLLVAAATDVGGDPYEAQGAFFVYDHDEGNGYRLVSRADTGTVEHRGFRLRQETSGAWAVDNALEVVDLTGDGRPEIVLGVGFYTRTTRIYNLEGEPPSLVVLWEDDLDTADSNAVLPYELGGETVLFMGMGYSEQAGNGFEIRSLRWDDVFGRFDRGLPTPAEGAVWDLEACDLDGDGVDEIIASVHYDPRLDGSHNHIRILQPNADLPMTTLLEIELATASYGVIADNILPERGPEVLVAFNHLPPQVFSFSEGVSTPSVYNITAYGPGGSHNVTFHMVCRADLDHKEILASGAEGLFILRCGPDLALRAGVDGDPGVLQVEAGAQGLSVRVENVGALSSDGGQLQLVLEGGWSRDVVVPPVLPGEEVVVTVEIPDGPYDGNASLVLLPSAPNDEVFDWNDRWEGRLSIPPIGERFTGDPEAFPGSPFPWLLVVLFIVGSAVAFKGLRSRPRGRSKRRPEAPPVLIWKRDSMDRLQRVQGFIEERGSRGARVQDVSKALGIAPNSVRNYLRELHKGGRLNRYQTTSGWLYVRSGLDPPPGTLQGLGRTASALYGIILSRPDRTVKELTEVAIGANGDRVEMGERMVIYNLGTMSDLGLVMRRLRADGRTGIVPTTMVMVEHFLVGRSGTIPWEIVSGHLKGNGISMTPLEFRLIAPHLGVRLERDNGRMTIVLDR
jgi:hypothetical protein